MKKLTTICAFVFLVAFASSCKNEKSLQSYLVEKTGKEDFYTGDFPVSSILTAKADVPENVKETIKTIKKINVVFLQKTSENQIAYASEKATLKSIFKDNKNYKSLMSMKLKEMNVQIYYSGETDAIDEVIVFGYGTKVGVGVARLLGDHINPAKIVESLNSIDFNKITLLSKISENNLSNK